MGMGNRRFSAVLGGIVLGWALGTIIHMMNPGLDTLVILMGVAFGLGLGMLVAASMS